MNIIKNILKDKWPDAGIYVADKDYHKPSKRDIEWLLSDSNFENYKYLKSVFDCDDFSLMLHAFVRQEQYKERWSKPWAIGETWIRRESGNHALNIAVSDQDEILFVEPQNDTIRVADADAYYIRM